MFVRHGVSYDLPALHLAYLRLHRGGCRPVGTLHFSILIASLALVLPARLVQYCACVVCIRVNDTRTCYMYTVNTRLGYSVTYKMYFGYRILLIMLSTVSCINKIDLFYNHDVLILTVNGQWRLHCHHHASLLQQSTRNMFSLHYTIIWLLWLL